jgi:nucleotide-binding universal stress UspA family protein
VRIILAVDGSPSSEQARDLVAALAWPRGTSITVVTAFDIPTAWMTESAAMAGDWLARIEDETRRAAEASLVDAAAPLDGKGWTVDRRVVRGRAAGAILALAQDVGADLIVLGSRGHGTIASMVLGSVSAEIAEQARCSVLVARGPTVSRLLVATDGSECAGIIPTVIGQWDVFRGMPAIALSVAPVDSPAFGLMVRLYTLGAMSLEAEQQELRDRFRQYAKDTAKELSSHGVTARAESRSGDAADEIIRAAVDADADLIVTGSRCLHGLDRWLLGSVARNVLTHTRSSVLIVRKETVPSR